MASSKTAVIAPGGVALVTGGSRGLGHAVALSFAREGCSAVAILDILPDETMQDAKGKIVAEGAKCLALRCDVTDEKQVEEAIQKVVSEFGRLDYAANAAGITGPLAMIDKVDSAGFDQTLRVNSLGVFLCMKHEIIQMSKNEPTTLDGRRVAQRGAIVNFASVNSILSGATTCAYSASKHAVNGITKAGALEHRRQNIRVNAISPGFIWSNMTSDKATTDPRILESWNAMESRQGRTAYPEEIGDAVVMLCSPKLSLVNAHNLVCDNGFIHNENGW